MSLFRHYREGTFYDRQFLFYEEWTEEASELYIRADQELLALCSRCPGMEIGRDIIPVLNYYESRNAAELTGKIRSIPAFRGVKAPMVLREQGWAPDFASRYFTEDVPLGTGPICRLAEKLGVPSPTLHPLWNGTLPCWTGFLRCRKNHKTADDNAVQDRPFIPDSSPESTGSFRQAGSTVRERHFSCSVDLFNIAAFAEPAGHVSHEQGIIPGHEGKLMTAAVNQAQKRGQLIAKAVALKPDKIFPVLPGVFKTHLKYLRLPPRGGHVNIAARSRDAQVPLPLGSDGDRSGGCRIGIKEIRPRKKVHARFRLPASREADAAAFRPQQLSDDENGISPQLRPRPPACMGSNSLLESSSINLVNAASTALMEPITPLSATPINCWKAGKKAVFSASSKTHPLSAASRNSSSTSSRERASGFSHSTCFPFRRALLTSS